MSPFPIWSVRNRALVIDHPLIMGILNATPDSFSDGGRFSSPDAAVAHGIAMCDAGADIIDVGGESTRPGASPVSAREEQDRVLPIIERLARERPDAVISIDTVKSDVARAAIEAGAHVVNDVSGLRLDPAIGDVCKKLAAGLVLMHSRGGVADMASFDHARYSDVAMEVLAELRESVKLAQSAGLSDTQIAVDPGIGFSKKTEHSLATLAAIPRLAAWGFPIVVGVSRKRFIGEITRAVTPTDRLSGTLGANISALTLGARIFRVHDVRENRQALDVAWRILRGTGDKGQGKGSTPNAGIGEGTGEDNGPFP
jgi:dihydropteroate synthase